MSTSGLFKLSKPTNVIQKAIFIIAYFLFITPYANAFTNDVTSIVDYYVPLVSVNLYSSGNAAHSSSESNSLGSCKQLETTVAFYDADYQAVLNEAITNGYVLPSASDQNIQNQIISSLKIDGVWAKSDVILYFKGSGGKNFKLINWKNPTGPKAIEESYGGAILWTNSGAKGDGLARINTNFNIGTNGNNYTQNNAGFYVYASQSYTNSFGVLGGDSNANNLNYLFNTTHRQRINSDGTLAPVHNFSGTGLLGVSRNTSTSHIVSTGTTTAIKSHGSKSLENENIILFGYGNSINSSSRFDGEISYALIGGDMSDKLAPIEAAFSISSPINNNDIQAPSSPMSLSSVAKTDTTVNLTWSEATDDIAVTSYKIYSNSSEIASSNPNNYQVNNLTPNTSYVFTVTALDAAGNESSFSNSVSITTDATTTGNGGTTSGDWTADGNNIHFSTGNVGIGTNAITNYKLAVDGKIRSREVKVDNDNWADYVFFKNYKLPTLQEVENHIKEKGHLINIPSAKEVKANGIELGEMNKLLLEKIEELTLYIIEQNKRLHILENKY